LSEAALASAVAMTLAKGVLQTMAISKLKILGAMALACGCAWGAVRTFGQSSGLSGSQRPAGAVPDAGEPHDALTRSVEKLQAELDESVRRITEMRQALQDIRADLEARRARRQPSVAQGAASRLAEAIHADAAQSVSRLAEALKRHPGAARPSGPPGYSSQIYMLDLVEGGWLVAQKPGRGTGLGSLSFSPDGRYLLIDADRPSRE
jgi:hypothetical protein